MTFRRNHGSHRDAIRKLDDSNVTDYDVEEASEDSLSTVPDGDITGCILHDDDSNGSRSISDGIERIKDSSASYSAEADSNGLTQESDGNSPTTTASTNSGRGVTESGIDDNNSVVFSSNSDKCVYGGDSVSPFGSLLNEDTETISLYSAESEFDPDIAISFKERIEFIERLKVWESTIEDCNYLKEFMSNGSEYEDYALSHFGNRAFVYSDLFGIYCNDELIRYFPYNFSWLESLLQLVLIEKLHIKSFMPIVNGFDISILFNDNLKEITLCRPLDENEDYYHHYLKKLTNCQYIYVMFPVNLAELSMIPASCQRLYLQHFELGLPSENGSYSLASVQILLIRCVSKHSFNIKYLDHLFCVISKCLKLSILQIRCYIDIKQWFNIEEEICNLNPSTFKKISSNVRGYFQINAVCRFTQFKAAFDGFCGTRNDKMIFDSGEKEIRKTFTIHPGLEFTFKCTFKETSPPIDVTDLEDMDADLA